MRRRLLVGIVSVLVVVPSGAYLAVHLPWWMGVPAALFSSIGFTTSLLWLTESEGSRT